MSATNTNSWLRAQRKSDLVEIADDVGLKNYESYKKSELEAALDEYLAGNSAKFSSRSSLTGYFNSRSKALGSPVKKELNAAKDEGEKALKVVKRKVSKAIEEATPDADTSTATAIVRTPGRSLSQVAARIPLPATPADVANAVDRSTLALRQRATSIYQDSGISDVTQATRDSLSTVTSVLAVVSAWELFCIRYKILPSRYAFTIPAIGFLGLSDYPVNLPDAFLLVTTAFWSPFLTWALTSLVIPGIAGYFFNLSATNNQGPRTRAKAAAQAAEYNVDPLTFSIVKALVSYVVYGQLVTLGGLLSESSILHLRGAVYGGVPGILTGTAITAVMSIYDAVLKK
ncbi:hypothetical protein NLU13_3249 [Sarocladium strictum]|nr:hypothetical protein NLU13_3249 [Sarocladium strictum]